MPFSSLILANICIPTHIPKNGFFLINTTQPFPQLISASFVGYETLTVPVDGQDQINFTLAEGNQLDEVIVTSLGIKREKQALGYAVSEVSNESLEQRAEGDIARVLTGKASGVQITNQSGLSGSGTSIIIRGFNTFSQGNQPLFIVDGIPFSSETNSQGSFVDGNNGSSRFLDIDPNNIESASFIIRYYHIIFIFAAFGAVQLIDNLITSPLIISDSVGLHPMFVIIVVLIGGYALNILGMIIAVPFAAILKVIVEELIWGFKNYRYL